ncbi:Nin one binding Zn-ribbon like-domain-containing protein [Xylariales sp. AK1849]|nr:Nin one binding Zn-ribbon like-domain-containing protein [Xylariales sp. AK1849]
MESTEPQQATETSSIPPQDLETPTNAPNAPTKPIRSLVLDTGPLIKNDPPVSTLLAQAEELYTLPSVLSEIRDAATRARVETQLLPFLKLRSPKPDSVKFITDFARRTGDLEVLSRPDLHLLALAYELECERNGGDWRLRKEPGQKRVNGKSPAQLAREKEQGAENTASEDGTIFKDPAEMPDASVSNVSDAQIQAQENPTPVTKASLGEATGKSAEQSQDPVPVIEQEAVTHQLDVLTLEPEQHIAPESEVNPGLPEPVHSEYDDDEDGWITPSNLKKHQGKDQQSAPEQPIQKLIQAALLTSDYAMQNVALRINLNLVAPSMARITRVKTWVLRCHGCFKITRNTSKQFCPSCGQPTLTRVSCSTDQSGNFQIHLKKNFQYNNRGAVYSVPKPTHGTANGKYRGQGGGKHGWGNDLLLAEDQKEYVKKVDDERRFKHKDLMDEDYLPSILSGNRQGGGPRIRVGAGRSVNSKKRNG